MAQNKVPPKSTYIYAFWCGILKGISPAVSIDWTIYLLKHCPCFLCGEAQISKCYWLVIDWFEQELTPTSLGWHKI